MTPLSARLEAVLGLLLPCRVLADVCSDHGLVPIAAVERSIAQHAIAADLREAPLEVARQNIASAGLQERVTRVRGDGLGPLRDHAVDAVMMAGVSGTLMLRLCDAAPEVLAGVQQLIVQPNKDTPEVRSWALDHGWHLRDENMVQIRGRFFISCAFVKASGPDPAYALPELSAFSVAALCNVGPRLLARRDAVALRWCDEQCARLQHFVDKGVRTLEDELRAWQAARAHLRSEPASPPARRS